MRLVEQHIIWIGGYILRNPPVAGRISTAMNKYGQHVRPVKSHSSSYSSAGYKDIAFFCR